MAETTTYAVRSAAELTVSELARVGIVSEVVEDAPHPGSIWPRWRVVIHHEHSEPVRVENRLRARRTA